LIKVFPDTAVTPIQRKYFNETGGMQTVRRLRAPEFASVELLLQRKSYALAAASALVKYVEYSNNVFFAPSSVRVEFQASEDSAMIDTETIRNVELLSPLMSGSGARANNSMFGLLNHCATPGGVRQLRASLYQPPVKVNVMEYRLDAIQVMAIILSLSEINFRAVSAESPAALSFIGLTFHCN
jgi:DNA mismatch repair protein MSH4